MELSGKVISVTENMGEKTRRNHRMVSRYDVLINYEQGDYPKNAAISFLVVRNLKMY